MKPKLIENVLQKLLPGNTTFLSHNFQNECNMGILKKQTCFSHFVMKTKIIFHRTMYVSVGVDDENVDAGGR